MYLKQTNKQKNWEEMVFKIQKKFKILKLLLIRFVNKLDDKNSV